MLPNNVTQIDSKNFFKLTYVQKLPDQTNNKKPNAPIKNLFKNYIHPSTFLGNHPKKRLTFFLFFSLTNGSNTFFLPSSHKGQQVPIPSPYLPFQCL